MPTSTITYTEYCAPPSRRRRSARRMREGGRERCDSTSNSTPIEAVIPGLSKTLIAPALVCLCVSVCLCPHLFLAHTTGYVVNSSDELICKQGP